MTVSPTARSDGIQLQKVLGNKVQATLWVGNIPAAHANEDKLREFFCSYGKVQSTTVRLKAGINKSWAFVTFVSGGAAAAVLSKDVIMKGVDGRPVILSVQKSDLNQQLAKKNSGALSTVLQSHGSVTENSPGSPSKSVAWQKCRLAKVLETATDKNGAKKPSLDSAGSSGPEDQLVDKSRETAAVHLTVQLLRRVPLFDGLDNQSTTQLARVVRSETYPAEHNIFCQGGSGDMMYIVATGEVCVYLGTGGSQERISTAKTGDYFGEMALLSNVSRSASACTVAPTTCLVR